MAKTSTGIESFINAFREKIEGEYHDPLVIALVLAYTFNGKIYSNEGDFVTKIGLDFYDIDGLIDEDEIDTYEYREFEDFSATEIADEYNVTRDSFMLSRMDGELFLEVNPN